MLKLNLKAVVIFFLICVLNSVCVADQGETKNSEENSSLQSEVIEKVSKDFKDTVNNIFKTFTGAYEGVKNSFNKDEKSEQSQKKIKTDSEPVHALAPEPVPVPSEAKPKKAIAVKQKPPKVEPEIKLEKKMKARPQESKIKNKKELEASSRESDSLEGIFEEDSDVIFTQ